MNKKGSSIDQFDIITKLGEGGFGTVYKVKRKEDGKLYAMKKVKMLKLSHKEKENALNEIRILASVNSEFIVKYKDAFYNDASSELCIIMEFADKGDLQGKINNFKKTRGSFEESQIWDYTAQMLQGIYSLHSLKILHRDLKGANVFLGDEGKTIKLGDLNVSKVSKSNFVHTQTGTPYYLAPEVWKGVQYNHKCDVWSLGCVIYEMAALAPPFVANSMEELYKKVLKGNFNKIPSKYSSNLSKLISMCLIINPQSRPDIPQLLQLPEIAMRIKTDIKKEEKAQLLKTMKLPYGGLNQLKKVLPNAKYEDEEEKKEEPQQTPSKQTSSKQTTQQQQIPKQPSSNNNNSQSKLPPQQQQQNNSKYQPAYNRPGSASVQRSVRSQSHDRFKQNPPVYQQNQGYGYQQQQQQPVKTPQPPQNKAQQQQQPVRTPQSQSKQPFIPSQQNNSRQNSGGANPYSKRCSSQERLMDNYQKVNAYNQYGGYAGQRGGNMPYYQHNAQYQKPPSGQQQQGGKPPMGGAKPPMGPPKQAPPQQSPQFFGKRKSNY